VATITARKLSRETAAVIDTLLATGEPVLIIRGGRPVAALVAVDWERIVDITLGTAPEFVASLAAADAALASGEVYSMSEVLADLAETASDVAAAQS
jgi:antitoxin (DNA-binding transcriptional repressor) of toxin-antitoxin stability system